MNFQDSDEDDFGDFHGGFQGAQPETQPSDPFSGMPPVMNAAMNATTAEDPFSSITPNRSVDTNSNDGATSLESGQVMNTSTVAHVVSDDDFGEFSGFSGASPGNAASSSLQGNTYNATSLQATAAGGVGGFVAAASSQDPFANIYNATNSTGGKSIDSSGQNGTGFSGATSLQGAVWNGAQSIQPGNSTNLMSTGAMQNEGMYNRPVFNGPDTVASSEDPFASITSAKSMDSSDQNGDHIMNATTMPVAVQSYGQYAPAGSNQTNMTPLSGDPFASMQNATYSVEGKPTDGPGQNAIGMTNYPSTPVHSQNDDDDAFGEFGGFSTATSKDTTWNSGHGNQAVGDGSAAAAHVEGNSADTLGAAALQNNTTPTTYTVSSSDDPFASIPVPDSKSIDSSDQNADGIMNPSVESNDDDFGEFGGFSGATSEDSAWNSAQESQVSDTADAQAEGNSTGMLGAPGMQNERTDILPVSGEATAAALSGDPFASIPVPDARSVDSSDRNDTLLMNASTMVHVDSVDDDLGDFGGFSGAASADATWNSAQAGNDADVQRGENTAAAHSETEDEARTTALSEDPFACIPVPESKSIDSSDQNAVGITNPSADSNDDDLGEFGGFSGATPEDSAWNSAQESQVSDTADAQAEGNSTGMLGAPGMQNERTDILPVSGEAAAAAFSGDPFAGIPVPDARSVDSSDRNDTLLMNASTMVHVDSDDDDLGDFGGFSGAASADATWNSAQAGNDADVQGGGDTNAARSETMAEARTTALSEDPFPSIPVPDSKSIDSSDQNAVGIKTSSAESNDDDLGEFGGFSGATPEDSAWNSAQESQVSDTADAQAEGSSTGMLGAAALQNEGTDPVDNVTSSDDPFASIPVPDSKSIDSSDQNADGIMNPSAESNDDDFGEFGGFSGATSEDSAWNSAQESQVSDTADAQAEGNSTGMLGAPGMQNERTDILPVSGEATAAALSGDPFASIPVPDARSVDSSDRNDTLLMNASTMVHVDSVDDDLGDFGGFSGATSEDATWNSAQAGNDADVQGGGDTNAVQSETEDEARTTVLTEDPFACIPVPESKSIDSSDQNAVGITNPSADSNDDDLGEFGGFSGATSENSAWKNAQESQVSGTTDTQAEGSSTCMLGAPGMQNEGTDPVDNVTSSDDPFASIPVPDSKSIDSSDQNADGIMNPSAESNDDDFGEFGGFSGATPEDSAWNSAQESQVSDTAEAQGEGNDVEPLGIAVSQQDDDFPKAPPGEKAFGFGSVDSTNEQDGEGSPGALATRRETGGSSSNDAPADARKAQLPDSFVEDDDFGGFEGASEEVEPRISVPESVESSVTDASPGADVDEERHVAVSTEADFNENPLDKDEDEFGDFGGFESNESAPNPDTKGDQGDDNFGGFEGFNSASEPQKQSADEDFGSFESPVVLSQDQPVESQVNTALSDNEDFGDFGDFDSAVPASKSISDSKPSDNGNSFQDGGEAEDEFGDFGDFDSAPATDDPDSGHQSTRAPAVDVKPTVIRDNDFVLNARAKFSLLFSKQTLNQLPVGDNDGSTQFEDVKLETILATLGGGAGLEAQNGTPSRRLLPSFMGKSVSEPSSSRVIVTNGARGPYSHFAFPVGGMQQSTNSGIGHRTSISTQRFSNGCFPEATTVRLPSPEKGAQNS